jgi:hypothetical protein
LRIGLVTQQREIERLGVRERLSALVSSGEPGCRQA